MVGCLHREKQPPRRCTCGAWLSSGNPLDKCAPCNGGTWDRGKIPESVWEKVAAASGHGHKAAGEALAEIMEVG
jgi:hypothetical protein